MQKLLHRLGLIITFELQFEISKKEFIRLLHRKIDKPYANFPLRGKKDYHGTVNEIGFELKTTKWYDGSNHNSSKAIGRFVENNKLQLEIEINGFHGWNVVMFYSLIFFYSLFISASLFDIGETKVLGEIQKGFPIKSLLVILLSALFMFGIFYLVMKRGVDQMKIDLEHYLYSMINNKE